MAITVLLADDVAEIRNIIRVNLQIDGRFEVIGEAGDGTEAVSLARDLQPDVIVLDVAMPNMDGLQAIPAIHEHSPQSRILVLSGFDRRIGEMAVRLTADDFVPKSAGIHDLSERLFTIFHSPPKNDSPSAN